jgi:hypothetical protein
MWLIWLSVGVLLGASTNLIPRKKPGRYLRRGILFRTYSVHEGSTKTGEMNCQLEVGELERTDKMSKIEIINYIPSGTQHATPETEKNIRKIVDGLWIETSEIQWIVDSVEDQRDKKLEQILKS